MKIRVEVKLKPGHFDPEGDVTAKSLRDLGFPVKDVKVGKLYIVDVEVDNSKEALKIAEDMCKKLLANPVKDDYSIEVLPT
ncbi:MAG: phosphoribosylformylglycinamidine synthase subunit PurS [Thermoproteota archaeon]|nr:phosphoribosylformylglycinamidine synthase subunit PurS [Candidatus Brockarchaeota archaeon]MBO3840650.1 phosphoribosylformylglycinamidine synthase subunit PurS [Candidatus Brockarchaeota archaeon]